MIVDNKNKSKAISHPKKAKYQSTYKPKQYIPQNIRMANTYKNTNSTPRCYSKEFIKQFKKLTYRNSPWTIWSDFILMFACALSNPLDGSHFTEREELYLKAINRYNKVEQTIFTNLVAEVIMALDNNPEQDFLGSIYMDLNLNNLNNGQYFTPYSICQTMASLNMNDVYELIRQKGYITINDPTCGSGATLIAGINEVRKRLQNTKYNFQDCIMLSAQDIDRTTALMCYIQLSLLGVAAYIKVGNSLTEPMISGDNISDYWFTPMYFSDIWTVRRVLDL